VFGQAADDQLHGGLGNDALSGANGNDTFFFDTALNATTNVDHVTDFNASQDTVWLSKGVFSSLASAGTASGTTLVAADYAEVATGGATATIDAAAHILYDAATGSLYFDADGGTSANRTLFAILDSKPDLGDMGAGDFKVGL
jgi:serralysin